MVTFTGIRSLRYRRVDPTKHPGYREDDNSDYAHRQLIGYVGLLLPLLLIVLAVLRDGVAQWKSLDSISAYYYSGAVTAFVGMLVSLALFLFTYRGFDNGSYWADRAAAIIAAAAALGVALFPTEAPDGVIKLAWWTELSGTLHVICAITLFSMFAIFALFLFPIKAEGKGISPEKRRRNRVYRVCGVVIVASMIWAGIAGHDGRSIFWPESAALAAFAVSWLVKGHAAATIGNIVQKVIHR